MRPTIARLFSSWQNGFVSFEGSHRLSLSLSFSLSLSLTFALCFYVSMSYLCVLSLSLTLLVSRYLIVHDSSNRGSSGLLRAPDVYSHC